MFWAQQRQASLVEPERRGVLVSKCRVASRILAADFVFLVSLSRKRLNFDSIAGNKKGEQSPQQSLGMGWAGPGGVTVHSLRGILCEGSSPGDGRCHVMELLWVTLSTIPFCVVLTAHTSPRAT